MKMSPQPIVSDPTDLQSTRSEPMTRPSERKKMKSTVQRRKSGSVVIKAFKTRQSDRYVACSVSQNSMLLMEARAQLTNGLKSRERLLLLFTDSLIIAKTKSLYLKLKACISLSDIWLASCIHVITDRKVTLKNSFVIGWPTTNYVATFSSSETKQRWLQALQWHTCRVRQRVLPNAILLYVLLICHSDDVSPATVAVAVDVNTTAENVIHYIMQQYKLLGEVSDYQLCVNYEKEAETFTLIGHEFPFFILRHSLRSQQEHLHVSSEPLQEVFGAAQQTDATVKTPYFTLKTKTHTPGALLKHKRKRSLIGWALRRGHLNQSDDHIEPDPASHKLFGQSLSSICPDGNLPKPIMEFLRKLPGGVLCCDLYDEWMEILQIEDEQHRLYKVRRLLTQLPGENVTLLCHLFGVLYRIHNHSHVNQMTAANLALCIAPNMLWRSPQISAELEGKSALQVALLIQYLIESTPAVFGDDLETLFTRQINSGQELHESTDGSYLQHSSSEDTDQDFIASPPFSPEVHPLFFPLAALSLKEKRRAFPFHTDMPSSQGTYSCGTLDSISSHSTSSVSMLEIGQLSPSRDRCLSEPSMYFATPKAQVPIHAPVIRQSSYDAAVIDSRNEQSRGSVGLNAEQQSHNSGLGTRRRRYTFWKSPQIPSRFKHPAQKLASMSSLSSATTSSLSSLDSTLSLSSADPIPSPQDQQSRPFLFGAAARLRPLTPEMSRKRWTNVFTYEEEEKVDTWGKRDQETEIQKAREFKASSHEPHGERAAIVESENPMSSELFCDITEPKDVQQQCVSDCQGLFESVCSMGFALNPINSSDACKTPDVNSPAIPHHLCTTRTVPQAKQISNEMQESELTETLADTPGATKKRLDTKTKNSDSPLGRLNARSKTHVSGEQKVNRMKITFFPSAEKVMLKNSKVTDQTADITKSVSMETAQKAGPGFTEQKEGKGGHSSPVHIPQTMFFGENVPLVLSTTPSPPISVQEKTHCSDSQDVGMKDTGVCGGADVSIISSDNDVSSSVCSDLDENTVQNIKPISHDKDINCSVTCTTDDLHSTGSNIDDAHRAVNISGGYSASRVIKLFHGNANQDTSSPKPASKFSGTFRHTISIKFPVNVRNRVPAQNKPST